MLGAQNLIFFGPQFRYVFSDNSHLKKQFPGPSREVHLWALFPFFSSFFFLPFFVFSLVLFIFIIFCSFLHFLNFCFSNAFFIFLKKKVSSFLFSCISFKYVLLLASVSEFNCFLRSRCTMEMWCPDDIGRDSGDWGARFNSPERGGGSSPVKKEPPQIVLLLFRRGPSECDGFSERKLILHVPGHLGVETPGDPGTPEPSTTKKS